MRVRVLMAILASGALLGLVACGSSGSAGTRTGPSVGARTTPSAASLESDAFAALRSAQSVKLSGSLRQNGQFIRIDMGFFRSGAGSGSLTVPYAGKADVSLGLIITGGVAYIRVDEHFLKSVLRPNEDPADICSIICGKYIKVPAKQFGDFNLKGLINQGFSKNVKVSPTVTTPTVNGQQVYRLTDAEGDYLYVAKNGTHYPVEITRPGSGALVFSEWNSVPPISAPPSSQIISLPGAIG
jgi:hypothetical protein